MKNNKDLKFSGRGLESNVLTALVQTAQQIKLMESPEEKEFSSGGQYLYENGFAKKFDNHFYLTEKGIRAYQEILKSTVKILKSTQPVNSSFVDKTLKEVYKIFRLGGWIRPSSKS